MEMLLAPVPIFNQAISVEAYLIRYQYGNHLLQGSMPSQFLDGAMKSPLLETLNVVGLDAVTMGMPVFVPVNNMMLLGQLEDQVTQSPEKIIFVVSDGVRLEESFLKNVQRLHQMGFRFAMEGIRSTEPYGPILEICDYIFLECTTTGLLYMEGLEAEIREKYPLIRMIVSHIRDMPRFYQMRQKGYSLYEGIFYRNPIPMGTTDVNPLKVNLVRLLNLVQDEHFQFAEASLVIQRDTALTVSLMRMVNSPSVAARQKIRSIDHAVAILGEVEVRKWVTTAVAGLMGADRPNEITRLSQLRARFAENLAPLFKLEEHSSSLFLMGLFSVLDAILEVSCEDALTMVKVSDPIRDALLNQKGPYGELYRFIIDYENADWYTVSRALIVHDIDAEDIYEAYLDALTWYRDLLAEADSHQTDE